MDIGNSLTILLGAAWLLPLASFALICLTYSVANLFRIKVGHAGLYGGYIATAAIVIACGLSMVAMFGVWLPNHPLDNPDHHAHAEDHGEHHAGGGHSAAARSSLAADRDSVVALRMTPVAYRAVVADEAPHRAEGHAEHGQHHAAGGDDAHGAGGHAGHGSRPKPSYTRVWYSLFRAGDISLDISFYFDTLTVAMFCMVTFIASCIHFYAMGYMHDELHDITDHEVTLEDGEHLRRPGRFHRFFQYLSLFCFSMLGIVISGNVAMTFVFWELVGICSYFLIGFYIERKSASNAANKAFIVNRVGDFGMIIGLMALFGSLGTFSFGDVTEADGTVRPGVFSLVRPESVDGHSNEGRLIIPDGMVLANKRAEVAQVVGDHARLGQNSPEISTQSELASRLPEWRESGAGYWLLVIAGLGIFCGCVGKSAQFPLHVWLPDAMEGPTPVSALVHSATMVAAGVFLVGRFYPVFTPEVLLTIAYIGAITLIIAATIALTAHDIKRVLAYSTVSQLGYMMLALGVGGWIAGLFHLFTHAFFKSLLFMCSGSVIHAVHTNDMNEMGGLRKKMPITAYTMLCGCLAIIGAGIPFVIGTSGYYSKDAILEQALLYTHGLRADDGSVIFAGNDFHSILFYAVAGGAALTAFYMFRMWYMTFAGHPRDHHRYDHAHESPRVMTIPLIILAVMAIIAGWKLPDWEFLGSVRNFGMRAILNQAQPDGTAAQQGPGMLLHDVIVPAEHLSHEWPIVREATLTAFFTALSGLGLATVIFGLRLLDPEEIRQQFRGLHRFLVNKWYFDELYNFLFVQPVLFVSRRAAEIDKQVLDWIIHTSANVVKAFSWLGDRWIDRYLIDGLIINGLARKTWDLGHSLHRLQTGRLRQYVMFIIVGTIALFMIISFVWSWGPNTAVLDQTIPAEAADLSASLERR